MPRGVFAGTAGNPITQKGGNPLAAIDHVDRDLARFNATFRELGAIVTDEDGRRWIDPSKVPADVIRAYRLLLRYAGATGRLPYRVHSHGLTWKAVYSGGLSDLAVGVTFVRPGVGTAYHVRPDGTVYGHGWLPLDGVAWTVRAIADGEITAVSHDGQEVTEAIPTDRPNLRFLIKR